MKILSVRPKLFLESDGVTDANWGQKVELANKLYNSEIKVGWKVKDTRSNLLIEEGGSQTKQNDEVIKWKSKKGYQQYSRIRK